MCLLDPEYYCIRELSSAQLYVTLKNLLTKYAGGLGGSSVRFIFTYSIKPTSCSHHKLRVRPHQPLFNALVYFRAQNRNIRDYLRKLERHSRYLHYANYMSLSQLKGH